MSFPDLFQVVSSKRFSIEVLAGATLSVFGVDDRQPLTDKLPYEKLPADVKKQVQAELDKMYEMKKNGNPPKMIRRSIGGVSPPPP